MISLTFLLFIPLIASRSIDDGLQIINGKDALDNEFPYMVCLREGKKCFCGGSLIGPNWVLTAAHCLVGKNPNALQVLYNTTDSYPYVDAPLDHRRNVTMFIIHNDYKNGQTDIGLVKLADPIIFPKYMQLANVPIDVNATVTAVGWGVNEKMKYQIKLKKIDLTVYDHQTCKKYFYGYHSASTMCAGSAKGRTCFGDSGAPVINNNVQYGIVAFGIDCLKNLPNYFTKVAALRTWIRQFTGI